ncbi:hypothetical protein M1O54_02690 [Dehalococcoidia bacterium]|nr:hypothetical protein [Dehalococcoidia bacterium]
MTAPQAFHSPKAEVIAYMFAIERHGRTVGSVLVGSSAYGYSILEASQAPPFSIPPTGEVVSILREEHALQIAEETLGEPKLLLLNILRGFYAVWEVERQVVGINLVSRDSFVAPRLQDITTSMPSPEEYEAAKTATTQSLPLAEMQLEPAAWHGQGSIALPDKMDGWWPTPFLRLPEQHPDRRDFWCGPASATTIALWKRDVDGDVGFPQSALVMFDGFHAAMGGWDWTTCLAWSRGFRIYAASLEHPEYFTFTDQDIRRPGFYWNIVTDIRAGWPLALMGWMKGPGNGLLKPHWVAVEGYAFSHIAYMIVAADTWFAGQQRYRYRAQARHLCWVALTARTVWVIPVRDAD